jgi:hypothetical protein
LPEAQIDFPMLPLPLKRERFGGPLKPIKSV